MRWTSNGRSIKRFARLISYTHHTCEHWQFCFVGTTAQHCRLGLFQHSDFSRDLEDSKSTSGGILCIFGSHTLVPISWMCKKQTSASHSSTEAEVISLDASLRIDGIPALDLWDSVIEVFHSSPNQTNKNKDEREPQWNLSATLQSNMRRPIPTTSTNPDLTNIDHVPSSGTHSGSTMLYVFEETEAVIKMIIKGRSPTVRHVSRTHRVALSWLFDRIHLGPKIQNINSQTFWPKVISHVTGGTIFFICSTSAISALLAAQRIPVWQAVPKRWRTGRRSKKEKKEVWQNRNLQRRTCLLMFRQVPHPRKVWLLPKVPGYSELRGIPKAGQEETQNPTQRRVLKRDWLRRSKTRMSTTTRRMHDSKRAALDTHPRK